MLETRKKLRAAISLFLIAVTGISLIWYLQTYPAALAKLMNVAPKDLAIVNVLYICSIFVLSMNLRGVVHYSNKRVTFLETLLVSSYSSWVNFFVPGQSGPGVRAIYLKAKHGVPVRAVMFGTLVYMFWLMAISGCMILSATFVENAEVPLLLIPAVLIAIPMLVLRLKTHLLLQVNDELEQRLRLVAVTGIWTLIQIALIGLIYYIELTSIEAQISIKQSVVYTGIANLSLFVAITPGAIGIREAFLAVSQSIHKIPLETIAAASALDRAIYIVLIIELSLVILFTHARDYFRLNK